MIFFHYQLSSLYKEEGPGEKSTSGACAAPGIRSLKRRKSAQRTLLVSADLTSDRALSATSKVATLHRRGCSLSVDLSTNEISATGGHLCFVHRRLSEVRPCTRGPAWALWTPIPAMLEEKANKQTAPGT